MNKSSYQDQHLDLLIRMAFQQIEEETTEQFVQTPDPALNTAEIDCADRAFNRAVNASTEKNKADRKQKRKQNTYRSLRVAAAVLIAVIGLALIALPIAFAVSPEFRDSVMKLFAQTDSEKGQAFYSFQAEDASWEDEPKDDSSPDFWYGERYPQYIPEGFTISSYDEILNQVIYTNASGDSIQYAEFNGQLNLDLLPPNAEITYSEVPGNESVLIEDTNNNVPKITMMMGHLTTWNQLICEGLSREDAQKIANSIEEFEGVRRYDAFHERQNKQMEPFSPSSIPDWWCGKYAPTVWPDHLYLDGYYGYGINSFQLLGENDVQIDFAEYDENAQSLLSSPGAEFSTIQICGREAYLSTAQNEDWLYVSLCWANEEAWFELDAYNVPENQVIAMAESTKKIDRAEEPDRMAAYDENGMPKVPFSWNGEFCFGWLPEDLSVFCVNNSSCSYKLINENGQKICLQEYILKDPELPAIKSDTSAKVITINGAPALLLRTGDEEGSAYLRIDWDISSHAHLKLTGDYIAEETLIRIAENVRRNK
ncbi:MAG: DUF4367 domain-containing protein [Clostridiales bacterium]|nr:DUF4367 domain-containing protein [Clostridiales bacterium]